jgi:hypothetical protein
MRALRDIVTSGELGMLLHIEGHNSNENSEAITQGWRLSPEESPGGRSDGRWIACARCFRQPARTRAPGLCPA